MSRPWRPRMARQEARQGATAEEAVVGGQRAQGRAAIGLGSPAVVPGDAGPQLLPHLFERGEHGYSAVMEAVQLVIEGQQLGEELVALDLEAVAFGWAQV